jgi:serine/threonine-protein kinase RsbW
MAHARGSARQDEQVGEAPRPDTSVRWQRLFRGQESELRQLRRWLTTVLPDSPARDDLISVAVELGTNAIQHTFSGQGGCFTVQVTRRGAVTGIDVTDEGAPGGPQVTDDPMSDCGRGLIIVRALSESCGVRGDARGRTVWAEVAWAPAPVPVSAPRPTSTSAPAVAPVTGPNGFPALNGHHLTRPVGRPEATVS